MPWTMCVPDRRMIPPYIVGINNYVTGTCLFGFNFHSILFHFLFKMRTCTCIINRSYKKLRNDWFMLALLSEDLNPKKWIWWKHFAILIKISRLATNLHIHHIISIGLKSLRRNETITSEVFDLEFHWGLCKSYTYETPIPCTP